MPSPESGEAAPQAVALLPPCPAAAEAVAATERWLERAVIGLGLCPFAAGVKARGAVRLVASEAESAAQLLDDLGSELQRLVDADPADLETTLLIHPRVLNDFDDYNRFLGRAERRLARQRLRGVVQIASFHPRYRFAGSREDDPANLSNRAPHPVLQLLRERSIEQALQGFGDPRAIYRRNIERLRRLGAQGWAALGLDAEDRQGP